jgi:hypothetical protein
VQGFGFRVSALGYRDEVSTLGFRVLILSPGVYGLRMRDEGSWIRVEGVWYGVQDSDATLRPLGVGQGAYALGFWFGGWLIVHQVMHDLSLNRKLQTQRLKIKPLHPKSQNLSPVP